MELQQEKTPLAKEQTQLSACTSIAVLGTGSDVGKSTIAAGLCRILSNVPGVHVAPFKAQNMSNNARPALMDSGQYGEIGVAQAIQAQACRVVPRVEMNPVLLKSGGRRESDGAFLCSVYILGKHYTTEDYGQLKARTRSLMDMVVDAHSKLQRETKANVIVLEGAGSCTELNLMDRDIVNIPLVRRLNCRWFLVANIDPGGVFAQIVGTKACLTKDDWDLCAGIIVNKLRGDVKYFEPGPAILEEMTGKPVFVIPHLYNLDLPEEDGMGVDRRLANEKTKYTTTHSSSNTVVVVVAYPHISMMDDILPLEADPEYDVQWRRYSFPTESPQAIILPGSKQTQDDLMWLKEAGWDEYILQYAQDGGRVLGLCGGYQMLGATISDPYRVESNKEIIHGLGLLPVRTELLRTEDKVVRPHTAILLNALTGEVSFDVFGFELHCGKTEPEVTDEDTDKTRAGFHPLLRFEDGEVDGLTNGTIHGTYLHGILNQEGARQTLLLGYAPSTTDTRGDEGGASEIDNRQDNAEPLDMLADHMEKCGLTYHRILSLVEGF